jgi:hypothetical protein
MIVGSLLKFSMGLKRWWEILGEVGGLAVRNDGVADKTATFPYFF